MDSQIHELKKNRISIAAKPGEVLPDGSQV
jgi:hypothetical protein